MTVPSQFKPLREAEDLPQRAHRRVTKKSQLFSFTPSADAISWNRVSVFSVVPLLLLLSTGLAVAGAPARIVAAGSVPADALDNQGETIGGIGSAIEVLASGEIAMLSDRGAGDGTIDYRPRLQFFTMTRNGLKLGMKLVRTLMLRDSNDHTFTGLFPDCPATEPPQRQDGRMCLDPEGLAVAENGHFFISEEYMPSVREFDADGKFVRRLPTPAEFLPRGSAGPDFAADDKDALVAGREPNRGFEGVALLPDGKLATVLQSGLLQDGGRDSGSTRLVVYDPSRSKAVGVYLLALGDAEELDAVAPPGRKIKAHHLAVSSLASLPDGRLLALERDNFGADGSEDFSPARWKAVVLLDLRGADNLVGRNDVSGAVPVTRTVLFNLAALDTAKHGLTRDEMPAKWEGLAVETIEDGRVRLLLSSDNDFLVPELSLSDGHAPRVIPFPRAARAQDTWIFEVETVLPPLSASNHAAARCKT